MGILDSLAFNYNPIALEDDGSCEAIVLGCINPEAFNYQYANTDDGSCLDVVYGCTDILAANFDSLATTDNDTCIGGCTDTLAINYEEYANSDDGSCISYYAVRAFLMKMPL